MKINEKTGLYENYGLWHVPFWQTEKFQLVLKISGGLIVLIVVAILVKKYFAYRTKRKLSPWDQALVDLRTLKQKNKVSAAYGKEFYVAISGLLKKYLYERFGYDVLSKTDDEVICYLKDNHADQHILEEVNRLLQGGVVIKFANGQVEQEQVEHDYVRAIAIIKSTIPVKK